MLLGLAEVVEMRNNEKAVACQEGSSFRRVEAQRSLRTGVSKLGAERRRDFVVASSRMKSHGTLDEQKIEAMRDMR